MGGGPREDDVFMFSWISDNTLQGGDSERGEKRRTGRKTPFVRQPLSESEMKERPGFICWQEVSARTLEPCVCPRLPLPGETWTPTPPPSLTLIKADSETSNPAMSHQGAHEQGGHCVCERDVIQSGHQTPLSAMNHCLLQGTGRFCPVNGTRKKKKNEHRQHQSLRGGGSLSTTTFKR